MEIINDDVDEFDRKICHIYGELEVLQSLSRRVAGI